MKKYQVRLTELGIMPNFFWRLSIVILLQWQMNSPNFITNKLLPPETLKTLHWQDKLTQIQYFLLDTLDFIDHRKLKGVV